MHGNSDDERADGKLDATNSPRAMAARWLIIPMAFQSLRIAPGRIG